MDDILIASESVEENLITLEEVLLVLKKYRFELNYEKCLFLKTEIEFLGYVISGEGITLSARHTEAIREYHPISTSTSYVCTVDVHVGHCVHPLDVHIKYGGCTLDVHCMSVCNWTGHPQDVHFWAFMDGLWILNGYKLLI